MAVKFGASLTLTTRLVALSGLFALLMAGESPVWLIIPAIVIALAGISPRLSKPLLSGSAVAVSVLSAFGFAVLDFYYISGSLMTAGADFLVVLLVLKLMSLREDKDYIQLFAVSFFLLLASTGLSTEIYFLAAFLMFFVSLTWALILLTVKSEAEVISGAPPRFRVGRKFFGGTAAVTLFSLVFTLIIFLVIPRVGIGYFSKRAGGMLKISGFSDKVDLGSMGQVLLDPTVVMRVQLSGPVPDRPSDLYFRGRVFDYYDGSSWQDTMGAKRFVYRSGDGLFDLMPGKSRPVRPLVQTVTLEPIDSLTIFALSPAYDIKADFRMLVVDKPQSIYLSYVPGGPVGYTVYSGGKPLTQAAPAPEDASYLQLPEGMENVEKLARDITTGIKSPAEKAARVMEYLGANMTYSLDSGHDTRETPIDNFLFHSKKGYCEHFATAMVLMLRSAGVMARLVSGFHGGEWNAYGGYYLIRAQDAHTWTEVFIPGEGWTRFDPTPAVPERSPALFMRLTGLFDYLRFRWDRYIVFYNLRDQSGLAKSIIDAAQSLMGQFRLPLGRMSKIGLPKPALSGTTNGRPIFLAALLTLLAAVLAMALRRRNRRMTPLMRGMPFYMEMLRILEKRGHLRRPGVTPLEFIRELNIGTEGCEAAEFITGLYNRARFGGVFPSDAEKERARDFLALLMRISGKDRA
ncbi:MAG: DUF3488 and transglutaminase-like domain-containing protein [Nitrospirota bacterium]